MKKNMTKALIYMGGNIKPIEIDVKEIYYGCYDNPEIIEIISTNGKNYKTHISNVLVIAND